MHTPFPCTRFHSSAKLLRWRERKRERETKKKVDCSVSPASRRSSRACEIELAGNPDWSEITRRDGVYILDIHAQSKTSILPGPRKCNFDLPANRYSPPSAASPIAADQFPAFHENAPCVVVHRRRGRNFSGLSYYRNCAITVNSRNDVNKYRDNYLGFASRLRITFRCKLRTLFRGCMHIFVQERAFSQYRPAAPIAAAEKLNPDQWSYHADQPAMIDDALS